jgi:hypothetical protein
MGAGFREEHERYFLCNAFSIAEIPPRLDPMITPAGRKRSDPERDASSAAITDAAIA